MLYKDKETDKIEMVRIEQNTPIMTEIVERGRKILEDKSVEWAFWISSNNLIIKPEKI